jgi:hypothetical protein
LRYKTKRNAGRVFFVSFLQLYPGIGLKLAICLVEAMRSADMGNALEDPRTNDGPQTGGMLKRQPD